jgi:hypothetical protein
MAKVIEFYIRDLFPKKVKSVPRDQLGKLIEFPNDKAALASRTSTIPERDEDDPLAASRPGTFYSSGTRLGSQQWDW